MFSTTVRTSRNVELLKDHILKAATMKGFKNCLRIPKRPPIFCIKRMLQYWTFAYNHNS